MKAPAANETDGRGRRARKDVEALAREMIADNYRVRVAAVRELGKIGNDQAVSLLCDAMGDPRKQVRARAAQYLGRLRASQAVGVLASALHDRAGTVRKHAVDAVGKAADADTALTLLLPMLQDTDPVVVCKTVEVFGALKDIRAVEPLLTLATDRDSFLQRQIILALAPLRDLRTVLFLCEAVRVGTHGVSALAAHQLRRMGDDHTLPRALVKADHLTLRYRYDALEALRAARIAGWFRSVILGYSLPPIIEYCDRIKTIDLDPDVRRGARDLLDHANLLRGSQMNPGATDLLRAASTSPDPSDPDTLLRAASDVDLPLEGPRRPFWRLLFRRSK